MRFQSVEWSRGVARVHSQLKGVSHYVLPDLPDLPSVERDSFFDSNTSSPKNNQKKIVTIAAGNHHSVESFDRTLRKNLRNEDIDAFLIVGGNDKNKEFSATDAISRAKLIILNEHSDTTVFCVANPNEPPSWNNLNAKMSAGADGVITQPIMSPGALDALADYPLPVIAGVSLPKTRRSLFFWLELLKQPELQENELFQRGLDFLEDSENGPLQWAQSQLDLIEEVGGPIEGLHFMPMQNTKTLLDLLGN